MRKLQRTLGSTALRVGRIVGIVLLLLAVLAAAVPAPALAQTKTVHVKEYTKKDGTVVKAHDRAASSTAKRTTPAAKPAAAKTTPAPKSTPAAKSARPPKAPSDAARLKQAEDYLKRSDAARRAFMKQTGYPNGRPGYIIDHVIPLACHGADSPSNMQWQTVAEAKAKDKVERAGCR